MSNNPLTGVSFAKCGNLICEKRAEIGQKYCCRECSPYGHLGLAQRAPFMSRKGGKLREDLAKSGEVMGGELAGALGMSESYISRLFNCGKIPGRREENGCVYYHLDSVRAAMTAEGRAFDSNGVLVRSNRGCNGYKAEREALCASG